MEYVQQVNQVNFDFQMNEYHLIDQEYLIQNQQHYQHMNPKRKDSFVLIQKKAKQLKNLHN